MVRSGMRDTGYATLMAGNDIRTMSAGVVV
jgi:hypothetical protein